MRRSPILLLAVFLLWASSASAEFVVLSSTDDAVAVGSVIADGQEIALAKNKTVMLIDQAGRTTTLTGPFEGPVKGKAGGTTQGTLVKALSSLIRDNEDDARSVGAIRASDKKRMESLITSKQSAMVVNISETGDYCLFPGTKPELVRYHSETGPKVTLVAVANGASHIIDWPKDAAKALWSDALPIADGARFLVMQEGKDTKTLITLHAIPDAAPTAAHLAVALTAKDCIEQARLMLVHIRRAAQ